MTDLETKVELLEEQVKILKEELKKERTRDQKVRFSSLQKELPDETRIDQIEEQLQEVTGANLERGVKALVTERINELGLEPKKSFDKWKNF